MKINHILLGLGLLCTFFDSMGQTVVQLDPTFGTEGKVITNIAGLTVDHDIPVIIPQSDGGILAGGWFSSPEPFDLSDAVLLRYLSTGELDGSFGIGGTAVHRFSTYTGKAERIRHCIQQADEKILCSVQVTGPEHQQRVTVYRFLPDGSVDSTYGVSGAVEIYPHGYVTRLIRTASDKVLVGFSAVGGSLDDSFVIAQLDASGAIDPSYGINGYTAIQNYVHAMALTDEGQLFVAGTKFITDDDQWQLGVSKLNTDGTLDGSFGLNGFVHHNLATPPHIGFGTFSVCNILLTADGGCIVGANINSYTEQRSRFAVTKLTDQGSMDVEFGSSNGVTVIEMDSEFQELKSVVAQADGTYLLVGHSCIPNDCELAIARLTPQGILDDSFGDQGVFLLDGTGAVFTSVLDPEGRLLVGGMVGLPNNNYAFYLLRVLTDLDLGMIGSESNLAIPLVYPNPMVDRATLRYSIKEADRVAVTLHELTGKQVAEILPHTRQEAGNHELRLDFPEHLVGGMYLLTVSTSTSRIDVRVLLR